MHEKRILWNGDAHRLPWEKLARHLVSEPKRHVPAKEIFLQAMRV